MLSQSRYDFKVYPIFSNQVQRTKLFKKLFDHISVTRVQPGTSKGITDLFLP